MNKKVMEGKNLNLLLRIYAVYHSHIWRVYELFPRLQMFEIVNLFKIEILYLSIVHRTFVKREFYEKWQGGDINTVEAIRYDHG